MSTTPTTPAYGPSKVTKHDIMGIRYMTDTSGAAGAGDAAAAAAAAADKVTADALAAGNAPWTKDNFDPERAYKLVENLRADIANGKTKSDADLAAAIATASAQGSKDALAQFAKLLAGEAEPETDPVKLAVKITELSTKVSEQDGTLTKAQADILAGKLATAVAIQAHGLGGSPKLLLANKEFMTSIVSVDPTDEAAITAKITAAIQANAALKATPSSSGGSEHQGGQTQDLKAQLAAAEKSKDFASAISIKRQLARLS